MNLSLTAAVTCVVLLSYAIGSIPFALISGYVLQGADIRTVGSGNAGATNVFRILGWKAAIFVLVADFSKGFLPVFYACRFVGWLSSASDAAGEFSTLIRILVLTAIVLGHAFPLWAGFRGGKGVACSAGGITAMVPLAAPLCLGVFVLVLVISSYVSAASLAAAWFLPLLYTLAPVFSSGENLSVTMLVFFLGIAILLTVLHQKNIVRLIRREESQFRFTRKSD